jgi:hypothetical protein
MPFKYFNKIHTLAFLSAFAFGMFFVYAFQPEKKIIVKHPTPQNAGKIIYHDKSENCYKFLATEIDCPSDDKLVMDHPIILS